MKNAAPGSARLRNVAARIGAFRELLILEAAGSAPEWGGEGGGSGGPTGAQREIATPLLPPIAPPPITPSSRPERRRKKAFFLTGKRSKAILKAARGQREAQSSENGGRARWNRSLK